MTPDDQILAQILGSPWERERAACDCGDVSAHLFSASPLPIVDELVAAPLGIDEQDISEAFETIMFETIRVGTDSSWTLIYAD